MYLANVKVFFQVFTNYQILLILILKNYFNGSNDKDSDISYLIQNHIPKDLTKTFDKTSSYFSRLFKI